jgi:hypothetical protein
MLYLTYNTADDGLGGQYQRIIGIMALAKKHQCTYVHNPIIKMEHIPNPQREYLKKIEDYFQIQNHHPNIDDYQYNQVVEFNAILDQDTDIYNQIIPHLRQIKQTIPLPYYNSSKNIAVHIRRGDVNNITHPGRYTPIVAFKQIIDQLTTHYPNSNVCVFTEITPENKDEFDIFQNTQIKIVADEDILTTMEYLIQSDVLVMCKSSFSYIAGLYNKNQVIYINFWHSPMPHWHRVLISQPTTNDTVPTHQGNTNPSQTDKKKKKKKKKKTNQISIAKPT